MTLSLHPSDTFHANKTHRKAIPLCLSGKALYLNLALRCASVWCAYRALFPRQASTCGNSCTNLLTAAQQCDAQYPNDNSALGICVCTSDSTFASLAACNACGAQGLPNVDTLYQACQLVRSQVNSASGSASGSGRYTATLYGLYDNSPSDAYSVGVSARGSGSTVYNVQEVVVETNSGGAPVTATLTGEPSLPFDMDWALIVL